MKKNVHIFIAGAKSLEGERNALKALAHDLNTGYEDKSARIKVRVKSYEDFRDNQTEYNRFIEQKADLCIFVLEGKAGVKTREEFEKAALSFKYKQKPEIILFIQETASKDVEIMDNLDQMVKPYLGDHYSEVYTNLDNLKAKAKQKIDQFVTPSFNKMQLARQWTISVLLCLCILFAGLSLWAICFRDTNNVITGSLYGGLDSDSKPILFAGGGSVGNFLKQKYSLDEDNPIDVTNYPNSIYANMPSGNAWTLLAEEYNRFMKSSQSTNNLHFRTVCLSASRATKKAFLQSCDSTEFFNAASIVECYLGEDPLVAYIMKNGSERYLWEDWIRNGRITTEGLASIIKNTEAFNIFSTSPNSGTSNFYQSVLPAKYSIDFAKLIKKGDVMVYNEASDVKVFKCDISKRSDANPREGLPYVVLGSRCYYSLALQDKGPNEYYALQVFDSISGNCFSKPIYIYFMAFKNSDRNNVVISKPICDFLKKTQIVNTNEWKTLVHNDTLLRSRDDIIYLTKRPRNI